MGGAIGGIATLVALIKTIEYYSQKDKEDKRIALMPYIYISIEPSQNLCKKSLDLIEQKGMESNATPISKGIMIKNVGLGSAIGLLLNSSDCRIDKKDFNIKLNLAKDQEFFFNLTFFKNNNNNNDFKINLEYADMLGHKYIQDTITEVDALQHTIVISEITAPKPINENTIN